MYRTLFVAVVLAAAGTSTCQAGVTYRFFDDDEGILGTMVLSDLYASASTSWGPLNDSDLVEEFTWGSDISGPATVSVPGAVESVTGYTLDRGRIIIYTNDSIEYDLFFSSSFFSSSSSQGILDIDMVFGGTPFGRGHWNVIPEPSTLCLFAIGILSAGRKRRPV
jgi:hypothetical protein